MSDIKEAHEKALQDAYAAVHQSAYYKDINLSCKIYLASLEASGFVIVPIKATEEMLRDGAARIRDFYSEKDDYPRTKAMWKDAIAARPRLTDDGDA